MHADPRNSDPGTLKNKYVHFHIHDAYVPEPAQILAELHGHDLLRGQIIDVSDDGTEPGAFVVVEVDGFSRPVVVPVAKIVDLGNEASG
jgi:hypothetical protein